MAFQDDRRAREVGQNGLERSGILLQYSLRIAADVALVVIEVDVLHLGRKARRKITLRNARVPRRGRRWRWRGHVDGGAGGRGSSGPGGGERVSCRFAREDAPVSGVLHRADGLIDRNAAYAPS